MLAAIFGALAHVAHKAAETVEEVGERIGAPQWVTAGLSGAFSALSKSADAAKEVELPSISGGLAFARETIKTTLGGMAREDALPQTSVKLDRNAEKMAVSQAPARGEFEFDSQNLGTLAPPALPMAVAQAQSAGMSA